MLAKLHSISQKADTQRKNVIKFIFFSFPDASPGTKNEMLDAVWNRIFAATTQVKFRWKNN